MEFEPYMAEELWEFSKKLTGLTVEDKNELLRLIKELDEFVEDQRWNY